MRVVLLTIVIAAASLVALRSNDTDQKTDDLQIADRQSGESVADSADVWGSLVLPGKISHLERYDDLDYGFSVAIPDGWTRIVAADSAAFDSDDVLASLEPGYAVGFESPRSGLEDQFADYILIEVLPGDDTGLFEATAEQRRFLRSGSGKIAYDRLEIDSETDDVSEVDLVIFQRSVKAFGYTLGFFAIGEPSNEKTMFDAFQILLRTYTQTSDPFVII